MRLPGPGLSHPELARYVLPPTGPGVLTALRNLSPDPVADLPRRLIAANPPSGARGLHGRKRVEAGHTEHVVRPSTHP